MAINSNTNHKLEYNLEYKALINRLIDNVNDLIKLKDSDTFFSLFRGSKRTGSNIVALVTH